MTTLLSIKPATEADVALLQRLGRETFYETFSTSNTAEDMQKYLDESFTTQKISEQLAEKQAQFFIARYADEAVGYLKINWSTAQTELQDEDSLEIERIYVKKSHQGYHIGQAFCNKALEIALLKKKQYLWLAVWEQNVNAIGFYERNGFLAFDQHIFHLGDDQQIDIMMKRIIG